MSARIPALQHRVAAPRTSVVSPDWWLAGTALTLLLLGLVMVGSASISLADRHFHDPFHYFWRQGAHVVVGLAVAALIVRLPMALWYRIGPVLLAVGGVLLTLVLIPGLGKEVNGATRWLELGPLTVQLSEVAKLFLVIYLAGYLVRRRDEVCTTAGGFLRPLALIALYAGLLLAEPDFGAAVVIMVTALAMLFLAGARLGQFMVLTVLVVVAFALLAVVSPYRMQRLTTFLDPWSDPFNSGFQLSQALIAFGRGEWTGVGLGASVQKLFYLPEAHTDFVFAVLAEELGLFGSVAVIALFCIVAWRALAIGRAAEQAGRLFGAFLAYGVGVWLTFQAFVNMGVNMGVLPTKGLTLPLMSYGGSSAVITCSALALLLRVDLETRYPQRFGRQEVDS